MSRPISRILFASPHCLIDFSSGAAIATCDALELLARSGFDCRAFCASKVDRADDTNFEQLLADLQIPVQVQQRPVGPYVARLLWARKGSIPVTVFRTASTVVAQWSPEEFQVFLAALEQSFDDIKPDLLLTYGGDLAAQAVMELAKRSGITVVFGLHNFGYEDVRVFRNVDYVVVPSEFAKSYYSERLGLACQVLPYAIDWSRVTVERRTPQYVTFVNPQPAKGVFVFARIAEQLARRRPDIPLLVVESRGAASWLEQTGLDLSWATNLNAMEHTHDPRDFYAVTKLLLVPSLWNESFGLVAAEAMINGIPVLASNRGALAEIVSDAGFQFDIPARYTPETALVPMAEEVEPWVETIIRLWDDKDLYQQRSERAVAHAQRAKGLISTSTSTMGCPISFRPICVPVRGGRSTRT